MNVLIDCDKVKHPNNGLFHFCLELVGALNGGADEFGVRPRALVGRGVVERVAEQLSRPLAGIALRYVSFFDNILFRCHDDEPVFHQVSQGGRFVPRNARVVLTIHDLNYLYEKPERKWARYDRVIRRNIARADHVVFISNYVKDDVLARFGELGRPCSVIYNGCCFFKGEALDLSKIEASRVIKPVIQPFIRPAGEFLFSVGVNLPKKNFHVLPALLVGNDLELVIAGSKTAYSEKIMEQAVLFGVADRVHVVGVVSEQQKDWYYRHCKAFVFASLAEGFGLPVIEAMSYGKPVFSSPHTSLREVGGEYAYFFDGEFEPAAMRAVLEAGFADFEGRDVEAQAAYAHSFSWAETARQYAEIYKSLHTSTAKR